MKTRRTFLARAALPVLVAGAFAWWGGTSPAGAADPGTTTQVSVSGTVSGAPESVDFAGTASVTSRLSPDPDFGNHKVVLIVDLRTVSGVGASTQTKYVISGPDIMHRPLKATDLVNITFPFAAAGTTGVNDARSGLASFALNFDVNTGAVTSATAAVATPDL
jgi:hypothetical protein